MTDSDSITLFIGLATVAGAIIGVFLTALLSRASLTSGLRQNWINSVREIFSKYLSLAEKWTDIPDRNSEEAYWARLELIEYVYQAKLHLNENESKSKELMKLLESVPETYKDMQCAAKKFQSEKEKIATLMQEVLKEEWNRVRDGEILWSINKFIGLLPLPKWFYVSRISFFWLIFISFFALISYLLFY
ncbi:hypothetical protein AB4371_16150 [Vibrio sp. 10N.261.51.A3]|uniref:hypothetical protein n=1 Tax=Vibrio TaxID=662 RepID=UPI000C822EE6|nr:MULTISPECIES: hypothetical protein [Vibrio]PMF60317.1 hypothetical protein BCV12_21085 [Vibrio cyclitrophicus]PMK05680.1 hypothetical protein BCU07_21645 [Vibrio sp. 10N.261.54.E10]TKF90168.1 hypothetical protein FCV73_14055 [Vibrio sp. F13]